MSGYFNRRDVGIQAYDRVNNLTELGVAEMSVDLGVRANTSGGGAERVNRPVEVVTVAISVQRK